MCAIAPRRGSPAPWAQGRPGALWEAPYAAGS